MNDYTQSRPVRLILAVILFMGQFLMVACDRVDSSLDRVQSSGTLRVGLDPTYPPFEVADDTGVTGLDVDLATELAAALGVEPAYSYFGYDGLYDALLTNQVDVLISALVISPERTRDFAYSRPYYDAGQVLIVPVGSPIQDADDLVDHRVAVELGALGHVEALTLSRSRSDLTVLPFGSAVEALEATAAGETDAALVDSISGRMYLRERGPAETDLRLLPDLVSSEPFALVVRIEDEALLQMIDAELSRMESAGVINQLVARWVGPY